MNIYSRKTDNFQNRIYFQPCMKSKRISFVQIYTLTIKDKLIKKLKIHLLIYSYLLGIWAIVVGY